jgi:hypothetical protein
MKLSMSAPPWLPPPLRETPEAAEARAAAEATPFAASALACDTIDVAAELAIELAAELGPDAWDVSNAP